MLTDSLIGALHAASVCEAVWLPPGGRPDAVAATPLVLHGRPALAFPYAYAALGRAIGAAAQVAVVLSDARLSGSAWRPIAVLGRPQLIEDTDGSVFAGHLLNQELRKHPPSRTLADSPILRREHWWFLPRLVVVVEPDAVQDVGGRAGGAGDGVLGVAGEDGTEPNHLRVATVRVTSPSAARAQLRFIGPAPARGAGGGAGPAVVLRHDFSTPDIERWTSWTGQGTVGPLGSPAGELAFDIDVQAGEAELPPPLGLMTRIRRQRDLARECRRALP